MKRYRWLHVGVFPIAPSAVALAVLLTSLHLSAQVLRGREPKSLASDEAAAAEEGTLRERSVTIPKNQNLLLEAFHEAQTKEQTYVNQIDSLKQRDEGVDAQDKAWDTSLAELTSLAPPCPTDSIKKADIALSSLRRTFQNQLGLVSLDDEDIALPGRLSPDDQTTITETRALLRTSARQVCEDMGKAAFKLKLRTTLTGLASLIKRVRADAIKERQAKALRAERLAAAWGKYRKTVENALEQQASPATKVASGLTIIIPAFCAFGLLMFVVVRFLPVEVQMEMVASGQMIQFATVMVLLIVVCVLGMSELIKDSTLGTLLGGIGGYVLSQGVGRAVARAAKKRSDTDDASAGGAKGESGDGGAGG